MMQISYSVIGQYVELLHSHLLQGDDMKRFTCCKCSRKFRTPGEAEAHIRKVHKRKKFKVYRR